MHQRQRSKAGGDDWMASRLGVLTEITVKVLPAAEDTRTLLISGPPAAAAVRMMTSVLQSTADVSAACHVPSNVIVGKQINEATTAFRLEGVAPSVDFRLSRLREQLGARRARG